MLFIKTCMLVTLDRVALTLLKKKESTRQTHFFFFFLNPKQTHTKETLVVIYALKSNMPARTEGGPAGCCSSSSLPQGREISIQRAAVWASVPERDPAADHCGPPSVRPPPVLVILLLRHGRYLFLHQPQLIAQVTVGF